MMNLLPPITAPTGEIKKYIKTINLQKEESKLFQFLNGLDDRYGAQESQVLMMSPSPTEETTCSL